MISQALKTSFVNRRIAIATSNFFCIRYLVTLFYTTFSRSNTPNLMEIAKIHQEVFDLLMKYCRDYPNFYFGLRQINRNSRLEKGYWFLGNDSYLSIPFWRGRDHIAKIPFIAFTILLDGTSYLEINLKNYYTGAVRFHEELLDALGIPYSQVNETHRRLYEEHGKDYIASLNSFVKKDKNIIDNIVKEYSNRYLDNESYHERIDFIWESEFKKQLNNIEAYDADRQTLMRNTGYLRGFSIKRFAQISNMTVSTIPKGCRWIFLTGENGTGKTTVLRALAAALLNNNDRGHRIVPDFEVEISLETPFYDDNQLVKGSDEIAENIPYVKGFAAYGPIRLITQSNLNKELFNVNIGALSNRATFGLFHTIGILRDANGPIIFPGARLKEQQMQLQNFLDSIEQNLAIILPNIAKVDIEEKEGGFEVLYHRITPNKNGDAGISFDKLSSGTQNFAALIFDLIIRFSEREGVSDISNFVGIVLIDEIDLHLHPKMQKEIVKQLSETFPNIQFIVSTHSPIPMLGAPENAVFINLQRDEEDHICATKLEMDITNLLPNAILTSPIFDFEELINVNHDQKERLITEDNYSDALFYKILEQKIRENSLTPRQSNDSSTN